MSTIFIGFDSAWGARNRGAICKLVLQENGNLMLQDQPISVNWDDAIVLARNNIDKDLCVWAIDQPICVANISGCRPVEADLARALMRDFCCAAHSSNLGNPCWLPTARIWDFLHELTKNGFRHNPMEIPLKESGRYYFECYPHPALIGLFNLNQILKYKVRQHYTAVWQYLLRLLRSLSRRELAITNIGNFVTEGLVQNQDNENKLDSLICAYVAAYWWKYGPEQSTMIGDTINGYMVTPHSISTRQALAQVFNGRINVPGDACAPQQPAQAYKAHKNPMPTQDDNLVDALPVEPLDRDGWSEQVTLCATDTSNLWRTSRGKVINEWMDKKHMNNYHLWVRFIEEDGQPAVLFEPFKNNGETQGGMKPAEQQMNPQLWRYLVEDATRISPIEFLVSYRYSPIDGSADG